MPEPGEERVNVRSPLSGLQGESQRSWEMGAELHNLTGAMNGIRLAGHWYVFVIIIIIYLIHGLTITLI
jgi:hypothetical protein